MSDEQQEEVWLCEMRAWTEAIRADIDIMRSAMLTARNSGHPPVSVSEIPPVHATRSLLESFSPEVREYIISNGFAGLALLAEMDEEE